MKIFPLLSLLVWLALPGAAYGYGWDDKPDCHDEKNSPKIFYKTTTMKNFHEAGRLYDGEAIIYYGKNVTVMCTAGDILSLRVQRSDTFLSTVVVNSTAIRWNISRPDVGIVRYICVDTISRCKDTLAVRVVPLVSVVGPGVRRIKRPRFYVPFGETYQILCTGNDANTLKIKSGMSELPIEVINETTLAYEGRADQVGTFHYYCPGMNAVMAISINVDYLPEAKEFKCTSYYDDEMACTWRSSSAGNRFNLFYMADDEELKVVCFENSGSTNRECKWNRKNILWEEYSLVNYDTSLRFVMQTCNQFFCHNQTGAMTHISIAKLGAVSYLSVKNTSSHGVLVSWPAPYQGYGNFVRNCFNLVYKVEYRLLHKRWRQADASSVNCDSCYSYGQCELKLNLDCPEQYYKIRVHVRFEEAEDRLWSEPTSASFYTAPAANDASDPACRAALQGPDQITSDMAVGEVYKLREYTSIKKAKLRKEVHGLQPKLDEVKSLIASLASDGDEVSDSTH